MTGNTEKDPATTSVVFKDLLLQSETHCESAVGVIFMEVILAMGFLGMSCMSKWMGEL